MTIPKAIWHLDLDSFFVSGERLRHPELRGKVVAVGGDGARGVISAASYEARRFGVRSAMATAVAFKLCPNLILCRPDHEYYAQLSRQVFSILDQFTPTFEAVSIDEGYLDMTGTENLFGPPLEAAAKLRAKILKETGLTASIGLASNRLVAKIASDFCKPDNTHLVPHGTEAQFLAPLSIDRIPGCGKVTQGWLKDRGITTVKKLQDYPLELLERHLGKFGQYLHDSAMGRGSTEFFEESRTRSISRETTFDIDVGEARTLERCLWDLISDVARSLRTENAFARGIRLKLRYPPFTTITRSRALASPTQVAEDLFRDVKKLFFENWDPRSPVRLIGVGCVLGEGTRQLGLFDDNTAELKKERLTQLQDELQQRFGNRALRTGRDLR